MRSSGLQGADGIPWGAHLCMFYRSRAELVQVTASFVQAGLAENELCLWIIPAPLSHTQAQRALEDGGVNVTQHTSRQQLLLVPQAEWYMENGRFNADQAAAKWQDAMGIATGKGFAGVRVAGGPGKFSSPEAQQAFLAYERQTTTLMNHQRFLALCTYPTAEFADSDMFQIMAAHPSALVHSPSHGWKTVPTAT